MASSIPIFVISYNRAEWLARSIQSYRKLNACGDIIIHDNGSSDEETLRALEGFVRDGVQVVRASPICEPDELNKVGETVRSYFSSRPNSDYVVTDCDIDLSLTNIEALEIYQYLLRYEPQAACVGPMLRISDISRGYPLFNHVMNRHISQFWHRQPEILHTPFGQVGYLRAIIDTTFAVHRAGEEFRRMKSGLRVYHPYEAQHLDWYVDDHGRSSYYHSSSAAISHWNNAHQMAANQAQELSENRYKVVVSRDDGTLEVEERRPLVDNPD